MTGQDYLRELCGKQRKTRAKSKKNKPSTGIEMSLTVLTGLQSCVPSDTHVQAAQGEHGKGRISQDRERVPESCPEAFADAGATTGARLHDPWHQAALRAFTGS